MAYEKLLQEGRIRPYRARPQEVTQLLQLAARDLATAGKLLGEDADWTFNIVYNAILQAMRALMLAEGFRPRGAEQHWTIVLFAREALGPPYRRRVDLFDQMRRKRHRLVYEMVGLVSLQEAEQALALAAEFVEELQERITGQPRLGAGEEGDP
jgi:uncharacterized protein (UPF0332 family)